MTIVELRLWITFPLFLFKVFHLHLLRIFLLSYELLIRSIKLRWWLLTKLALKDLTSRIDKALVAHLLPCIWSVTLIIQITQLDVIKLLIISTKRLDWTCTALSIWHSCFLQIDRRTHILDAWFSLRLYEFVIRTNTWDNLRPVVLNKLGADLLVPQLNV